MLNVCGEPEHPFTVGVAEKFPVTPVAPPFTPVNAAMFPVPDVAAPAIPIEPSELVQLTVETGLVTKFMAAVLCVAQTVWLGIAVKTGIGLTVIVKFCTVPVQPFNVGVAAKFPETAAAPALTPVKDGILPAPEVPTPIVPFELVQFIVDATGFTV